MDTTKKLFAFKLADKQAGNAGQAARTWKARDGVMAQACTGNTVSGLHVAVSIGTDTAVPC